MTDLRGAYMAFEHDYPQSWDWLEAWEPSAAVLLLPGSKDPNSVSLEKVIRLHEMHQDATIVLRVWAVDDNSGEAMRDMMADPLQKAVEDADYWARVFDRLPPDVRERCAAHLINEPHPREQGAQIRDYTGFALEDGTARGVPMMGYNWSVGEPPLAGEHQFDWPYFAALEDDFIAGNHIVGFHSYFQPEGMYGVWTDDQGNERRDWGYLVGRHLKSGITRAKMCWSEWGLEGSIYNRHTGRGWLNYPDLWWPARYADEYVECCRIAAPNVIGICPYIDDHGGWKDFHLGTAYSEFLARKHLCVSGIPDDDDDDFPGVPVEPSDKWERSIDFVLAEEGGFQNNPNDPGNYYNGQLIGTKYGISAASWGGQYDIPNLTIEQAQHIYRTAYWEPSGAAGLPFPLCLLVLDSAILHGVGAAQTWLREEGPDPYRFAGRRLRIYTRSDNWEHFGRGWVNRVGRLLAAMSV